MAALANKFTSGELFLDATLTRKIAPSFDPVTGVTGNAGTAVIPCRAVPSKIVTKGADGVKSSRASVKISVKALEGDILTIGENTYRIGQVTAIGPKTALLYEALVAK